MKLQDLIELENDYSFQLLNEQINAFNTLKILKFEDYEIRHSNILTWLLDPKENHHLGDYFLRKTLEQLILNENNHQNPLSDNVSKILNHPLTDCYVYSEVKTDNDRAIDLFILNHQLKCVILIENKIYSKESENQLNDYLHFAKQTFPEYQIIPVYLTLEGETPSNEAYFILTHKRIESILHTLLTLHEERLNINVYEFLLDYKQVLREKYDPDEEQILLAIDIYQNHKSTIQTLYPETSTLHKPLKFTQDYSFQFMMKYKNTINYISEHGKNILAYSFERFIKEQYSENILFKAVPTTPLLFPPEWDGEVVRRFKLKQENYHLGKGLIVWFGKSGDNRLQINAQVGPIKYEDRLWLLNELEKLDFNIPEQAKLENSQLTSIFSKKTDINKWDDMEELVQAFLSLYNSPEFTLVLNQVSAILNNKPQAPVNIEKQRKPDTPKVLKGANEQVIQAFKKWMETMNIPPSDYRTTSRMLSFKIPLFDDFKDQIGETREKWWWDNGPFLFWMEIKADRIDFILEVGPSEVEQRIKLLEKMQAKGIKFRKAALDAKAKYTRIYKNEFSVENIDEAAIVEGFKTVYEDEKLQDTLNKLEQIYDETYREN